MKKISNKNSSFQKSEVTPPNGAYLWTWREEGFWEVDVPKHEDLIKHATRFGTEQIAETAVDLGYDLERLVALIARLDIIDHQHRASEKTRSKYGRVSNRSPETRAKKLLNWEEPTEEAA